jgi:energy-coupling factor transport system permease protein
MQPVSKIFLVLCLSTGSIFYNNILVLATLLLANMLLFVFSKGIWQNQKKFTRRLKQLFLLIISIFLIQLLFRQQGEILLHLKWVVVTREGLNSAALVSLRLMILLLSGVWLTDLAPREFLQAFRSVRLPESLAVTIMMTLRYLPLLAEQVRVSSNQLVRRNIKINKLKLRERTALYMKLLLRILGWTLHDLKYKAIALDIRGFRNGKRHSFYGQMNLRVMDYCIFAICTGFLLLVGYLFRN